MLMPCRCGRDRGRGPLAGRRPVHHVAPSLARGTPRCSNCSARPATGRSPGSSVCPSSRRNGTTRRSRTSSRRARSTRRRGPRCTCRPGAPWPRATRSAECMYLPLLADAATVAGVSVFPGFNPKQIHVYRGTAKPGLNLTLDRGDEPGHVGWVDAAGTFGVPLDFPKGVPAVQAGLMISPNAFDDEKAMSMRTIRHEMVHVRHRQITLDAVTKWDAAGRKPALAKWVAKNAKRLRLSAADVALVHTGARGGQVDTEVLAYVEGFMTEFHLSPPTKRGPDMAFFELLGAVETTKFLTWKQAHAEGEGGGAVPSARLPRLARDCPPPAVEGVGRRRRRQARRRHDGAQGVLRRPRDVREVTPETIGRLADRLAGEALAAPSPPPAARTERRPCRGSGRGCAWPTARRRGPARRTLCCSGPVRSAGAATSRRRRRPRRTERYRRCRRAPSPRPTAAAPPRRCATVKRTVYGSGARTAQCHTSPRTSRSPSNSRSQGQHRRKPSGWPRACHRAPRPRRGTGSAGPSGSRSGGRPRRATTCSRDVPGAMTRHVRRAGSVEAPGGDARLGGPVTSTHTSRAARMSPSPTVTPHVGRAATGEGPGGGLDGGRRQLHPRRAAGPAADPGSFIPTCPLLPRPSTARSMPPVVDPLVDDGGTRRRDRRRRCRCHDSGRTGTRSIEVIARHTIAARRLVRRQPAELVEQQDGGAGERGRCHGHAAVHRERGAPGREAHAQGRSGPQPLSPRPRRRRPRRRAR